LNKDFDPIINLPYPKVEVQKKDPNLAYHILKLYAGNLSELTAVNQYSFQGIYLNDYKDLSKILENISIVEMRHLKILGELIEKLGLIPYYATYNNNKPIPWNSDYVNFTINYREMLVSDINGENDAIKEYKKIINMTDDSNIKAIINRIILDEERHIEILKKLLSQYDNDQ